MTPARWVVATGTGSMTSDHLSWTAAQAVHANWKQAGLSPRVLRATPEILRKLKAMRADAIAIRVLVHKIMDRAAP